MANTRKSVTPGYLNTEKWVEKTRRSRVLDMGSQTIHNSWINSKQKFAKFYAN